MKGKIYLSGPISGLDWEEATQWRLDAIAAMPEWECFDPMQWNTRLPDGAAFSHASAVKAETATMLFENDWKAVRNSDILLVNIDAADGKSLQMSGTISEIAWAWALKKPVVMVASKHWYAAQPFFIKQQITDVVYTPEQAFDALNRHSYTHQLYVTLERNHHDANLRVPV